MAHEEAQTTPCVGSMWGQNTVGCAVQELPSQRPDSLPYAWRDFAGRSQGQPQRLEAWEVCGGLGPHKLRFCSTPAYGRYVKPLREAPRRATPGDENDLVGEEVGAEDAVERCGRCHWISYFPVVHFRSSRASGRPGQLVRAEV